MPLPQVRISLIDAKSSLVFQGSEPRLHELVPIFKINERFFGLRTGMRFMALLFLFLPFWAHGADTARQTIAKAVLEEDSEKRIALIHSLIGQNDPAIKQLLAAWKDTMFVYKGEGETKIPVMLVGAKDSEEKQEALRIEDGKPLVGADGKPIRLAAADLDNAPYESSLGDAMNDVTDLLELAAPDPGMRIQAIQTIGKAQDAAKLPALVAAQKSEKNSNVRHSLSEAIALIQLKDEDPKVQAAACKELGELGSIPSQDFLKELQRDSGTKPEVLKAITLAQAAIDSHVGFVNAAGTVFRGLSSGSVLLVIAIGLAITFGLMGVINMAHGEIMVIGAYTTYVVQNFFGEGLELAPFGMHVGIPGLHLTGLAYQSYFIFALPASFLVAALVGIALERGIIQFLYRRPLESLLATWGVSLVLQQLFRLIFGANNVQVSSPVYLAGHWAIDDVDIAWKRVFVIGFAVVIIVGTHLVLTKTPLGLLIRAVMQNRNMAACMGVRTERVNMFTFAFGSGLAGLAGAFLSQLDSVGPDAGQKYIVDSFMTVVVGGVGNIFGTVVSALSIGVADQSLQQILLDPVLGKILVLGGIILFLQWRPAGLFVTKSRSLEG